MKPKTTEDHLRKIWAKEIRDHEHLSVDLELQTLMFWNLQLELFQIHYIPDLDRIAEGIGRRNLIWSNLSHEDLATEIALHLSGLK